MHKDSTNVTYTSIKLLLDFAFLPEPELKMPKYSSEKILLPKRFDGFVLSAWNLRSRREQKQNSVYSLRTNTRDLTKIASGSPKGFYTKF